MQATRRTNKQGFEHGKSNLVFIYHK